LSKNGSQDYFSLNDISSLTQSFLNDKIFKIAYKDHNNKFFNYVHLKIKKMINKSFSYGSNHNKDKTLILIINVSDKMLYNEVKAE
jgi:hypothetical protein